MNSKNNNTFNLHRLLLNFTDKINWKRSDKYVFDESYSVSDVQDYYEYIFKIIGKILIILQQEYL